MTVIVGYDRRGRRYYQAGIDGPIFYITDYGDAGAREKARQAERALTGRYYGYKEEDKASNPIQKWLDKTKKEN